MIDIYCNPYFLHCFHCDFQSDLRPIGRKVLPAEINSGKVDKVSPVGFGSIVLDFPFCIFLKGQYRYDDQTIVTISPGFTNDISVTNIICQNDLFTN